MSKGKVYSVLYNVGTARYVVNYWYGIKLHQDGSPAYDVRIFRSARSKDEFVRQLVAKGYVSQ